MKRTLIVTTCFLALAACEPDVFNEETRTVNPVNVDDQETGMYFSAKTASGQHVVSTTDGYGFACSDTSLGANFIGYGIATGDSLVYDPANMSIYSTDPNEHPFFLGFVGNTTSPSVGVYAGALAVGDIAGTNVIADASMVTVNVLAVSTDSISGNYSGVIERLQLDTLSGNLIPLGVLDTITGVFNVELAPCQ